MKNIHKIYILILLVGIIFFISVYSVNKIAHGEKKSRYDKTACDDMQFSYSEIEYEKMEVRCDINKKSQYSCKEVNDGYELTLYSSSNELVFSEVFSKEPGISWVTENVLGISISVGSPATYVFYFNTENSDISKTYFNPIIVGDNYVAYMENGELILSDIFYEDLMKMRITRNFTKTANPMSAVVQIEMIDSQNIILTYYNGVDFTVVEETIKIENNSSDDSVSEY